MPLVLRVRRIFIRTNHEHSFQKVEIPTNLRRLNLFIGAIWNIFRINLHNIKYQHLLSIVNTKHNQEARKSADRGNSNAFSAGPYLCHFIAWKEWIFSRSMRIATKRMDIISWLFKPSTDVIVKMSVVTESCWKILLVKMNWSFCFPVFVLCSGGKFVVQDLPLKVCKWLFVFVNQHLCLWFPFWGAAFHEAPKLNCTYNQISSS